MRKRRRTLPTRSTLRRGHSSEGWIERLAGDDGFQRSQQRHPLDRKSTRLNSSHTSISYAVFCLKKTKPKALTSLTQTSVFFFFNDTATTEIYTLSLHDALPISTATSVTYRIDAQAASHAPDAVHTETWPLKRRLDRAVGRR